METARHRHWRNTAFCGLCAGALRQPQSGRGTDPAADHARPCAFAASGKRLCHSAAAAGTGGKAVDTVPLYRVQTDLRKRELLLQELADTDYVFLASASAARAFAEMTAGTKTAAKLISIGNATTKAAETAGLSVAETAVQSDIAGMIACIRKENEV
ncbi:MAG: uroporphyrinogen-III synthase [Ruminococcus callidus]